MLAVDIIDRILDGGDLLGSVVGDFDAEFFFERHHQLDDIKAVCAQIVDEAGILGHLFGFYAQMLDDDFLYAIRGLTHERSFLTNIVGGL
ncbi:acyl carrier protein [Sphingomonas sp. SKA58]|nr:acyl carrier protein [Sphingomonas sp. SKA58]